MPSGRFALPGATTLKPLAQGSLSRLCGFYSVMNGVQLALHPQRLSGPQQQALYLHGVAHLARMRQLRPVLGSGMAEGVWLRLAVELVTHVNDSLGTSLAVKPILYGSARRDRKRAVDAIRRAVLCGSPVLAGLGGALGHYTVISGFTEQRLLLFDSSGLRWIETDGVGLGERSPRRHTLFTDSVTALVDDW